MFYLALTALFLTVLPGICLATLTKRKIEFYIAIMLPAYAVWLYLCGMVNCLKLGRYGIIVAIWGLFAAMVVYGVYMIRRKKGKEYYCAIRDNALTPGLLIFVSAIIFAAYLSFGRIYYGNDEFSHWGKVVKLLFLYDELPVKNKEILGIISFKSYPLGTSLIGYLFTVCYNHTSFCDYAQTFSLEILYFSFFTLFISGTKWRNFLFAFLFEISIFLSCLSLYNLFIVINWADPILGVSLAVCLYTLYLHPVPTLKQAIYLTLQLSFLILIKQSGAGLAVFVVIVPIIIGITQIIKKIIRKEYKHLYRDICFFIPLSAFLIHIIHKQSLVGIRQSFSGAGITLKAIYNGFYYDSNGVFQIIWDKMIDQLFFTKKTVFLVPTSYFSVILVISIIIYFIGKKIEPKNKALKIMPHLIISGFLIYSSTLLLYYNFSFSAYEGQRLAGFDRYISTYLLCSILLCFSIIYANLNRKTAKKEGAYCFCFIILLPFLMLPQFAIIKSYFMPVTNSSMAVYCSIFDQIIKQNVTDNDKFFLISQEDKVFNGLVPTVYFPHNYKLVTPSWGEPQFEGDIWSKNYSDKEIEKILETYQYCYLHKSNTYFVDHYSKYFSGVPDRPNVLYRSENGKFVPVPLKKFVFDFEKASLFDVKKKKNAYADYSARKGHLLLSSMKDGELNLTSKPICPLWNGSIDKIIISFGKIQGEADLSIMLNSIAVYEGIVNDHTEKLVINTDTQGVEIGNLSIKMIGRSEYSSVIVKKITLEYSEMKKNVSDSYVISPFAISSGAKINMKSPTSFSVTGKQSEVYSTKKILTADNTLSCSVKVKNTGSNATRVCIGYAAYTKEQILLRNSSYPYQNNNKILNVVSCSEGNDKIIVDSYTDWAKNCYLALDAKEDMSDVPNTDFAGRITEIKKLENGQAEITLTAQRKNQLAKGTKVRVHGQSGGLIYVNHKVLQPNEEAEFSSIIKKDESCLKYTNQAFSRGVYYVVPVILSYSVKTGEENTVLISDYTVSY